MKGMKKAMAIALAATMTMGSTLTVFAAETGSGTTSGQGENEGHVEKEVINVVLPTVPETTGSPFEYITDPERLIQSTAGARYEDYKFPDAAEDTGVYFLVGEKEYANTSSTLQVINKSSCDVTITVTAKATAASDKDLKLNTSVSSGDAAAPLYLSLKVGQTDQAISTTEATVVKTIEGNAANFDVQYTGSGYAYVANDDAYSWKALNISLSGAVSEDAVVANDTTAPTIDVTWAFAKAADGTSADTTEQVVYEDTGEPGIVSVTDFIKADPKDIVIKFSPGVGPDALDFDGVVLLQSAKKVAVGPAMYSVDMDKKTVTLSKSSFIASAVADVPIFVNLTKEGKVVKQLAGNIVVKKDYDPAEPEIISVTDFVKASPQDVVITFSLGYGDLAVEADGATLKQGAGKTAVGATMYSVNMEDKTVTLSKSSFIASATVDTPVYVVLTKGGQQVAELQGTIKVVK